MKTSELPELYKKYSITLTDKREFAISGVEKEKITSATETFIQLPNGDVINKSFIVSMAFDSEGTKDSFKKLSEEDQKRITRHVTRQ